MTRRYAVATSGFSTLLQQLGLRKSLSHVLPRSVYFLLPSSFAGSLDDTVGPVAVADAIGAFLSYLPNIVAAVQILLVGSALGRFAGSALNTTRIFVGSSCLGVFLVVMDSWKVSVSPLWLRASVVGPAASAPHREHLNDSRSPTTEIEF